tara:strand:+ start:1666 stop:2190 length:525 start_codon:yes stop_codon:yes gene_type:complete
MIIFKSADSFLERHFNNLTRQFNLYSADTNKNFITIDLIMKNDQLIFSVVDENIKFNLPLNFDEFFSFLKNKLINTFLTIENIKFYPFKNLIIYNDLSFYLKDIHNIIFSNLILDIDQGINKTDLYKILWPQDKDISINKLDTHLTNLKNQIYDNLKLQLQVNSKNNLLKLTIN